MCQRAEHKKDTFDQKKQKRTPGDNAPLAPPSTAPKKHTTCRDQMASGGAYQA